MKPLFVIVVLLVLAPAVPVQMLAQQSKSEIEIRDLVEQTRQINLKGGPEAAAFFEKYLAVDVVRIPSNGAILQKADLVNAFKAGRIKVEKADWTVDQVSIRGKWAIVSGRDTSTWTLNRETLSGTNRWTRVLVKEGGVWKTVLFQSTRMPVSAVPLLAAASTIAHARSCGIHDAIVDWKSSEQGPTETEKVMTVLENNATNGFLYCNPDEGTEAYDWTNGRHGGLITNGNQSDNAGFKLHNLQVQLWGFLHNSD